MQGTVRLAAATSLLVVVSVAVFGVWTQGRVQAAEVHARLGSALRRQHNYQAAAREYEEALRLRPRASNTRYQLADLYEGYLRDKNAAAKHYERLVALDHDLGDGAVKDAYRWLGGWYARQGRFEEAVTAYHRFAKRELRIAPGARSILGPPQPWVPAEQLVGLARGEGLRGADKETAALCTAALEFDPGNPQAKAWLGLATARLGETTKGLALCREAVETAPWSQEAQLCLGRVLLLADRPTEAVEALYKAVSRRGHVGTQAAVSLADALHQAGRCDEAVRAYGAAGGRHGHGPAMHGLAVCLRESGRLRESIEVYEKLVALLPHDTEARKELQETRQELEASR
jgi:tetratricopeptide (TPR) repeat protein